MKDNTIKKQNNGQEKSLIIAILRKAYSYRFDILIINLSVWFFLLYIGKNYSMGISYKVAGICFFIGLFYYFYRIYKDN